MTAKCCKIDDVETLVQSVTRLDDRP